MRFPQRITVKPAKTCSTHDFTIRKQYEDKTKTSKKFMDFSIFRGPGTVETSLKKLFFNSKSSKNMLFQHQIALKPAKTSSTHDFTIRKQYGDKTRNSKKSLIF